MIVIKIHIEQVGSAGKPERFGAGRQTSRQGRGSDDLWIGECSIIHRIKITGIRCIRADKARAQAAALCADPIVIIIKSHFQGRKGCTERNRVSRNLYAVCRAATTSDTRTEGCPAAKTRSKRYAMRS